MTKINLTKAALLAATALLSATSANAQVADNWDIGGDVGVTSTNSGADVKLDASAAGGIIGANIADGYKNSISSAAVGSSASSSFTAFNNSANASSAIVAFEGGVVATAGNDGAVLNLNDMADSVSIDKATVSNGNSISVASVGSSASVSGTVTAAGGTEISEASYSVAGDVVVSSGDGVTLGAALDPAVGGNFGDVGTYLATGMAAPTISDGNSNSISAAGVGSSASFSLTNNTVNADSVITTETLALGATATVTSTNTGAVTVSGGDDTTPANAAIDTAAINAGSANSISVAGVGSSASFSFANNTYDGALGSAAAALSVGDLVTVASLNEGGVTVSADLTSGTNIDNGNGNSISVAGVGASGSFSVANNIFDGSAGPATVTVELADISVSSQSAGEILVTGSITDSATIGAGSNNSISIAGVGTSASTSFTSTTYAEAGDGASATTGTVGALTLAALNQGAVTVTTGINTPSIATGFNNSISAAAVGASASQTVSHNVLVPTL